MFRNLIRPDNPLMIVMSQITDCIFLSLFWILGCFPVFTVGTSFAALYDATFRAFRQGERNSWQRFAHVYRRNWKEGILPTVLMGAVLVLTVSGVIRAWNRSVTAGGSWMVFAGAAFVGIVVLGIVSVLFPMLSRFENSAMGLVKNTVIIAMANLPRTVLLGLINGVTAFLCLRFVIPICFLPSLAALLGSLLIEPMFKPFMNEDAAA